MAVEEDLLGYKHSYLVSGVDSLKADDGVSFIFLNNFGQFPFVFGILGIDVVTHHQLLEIGFFYYVMIHW